MIGYQVARRVNQYKAEEHPPVQRCSSAAIVRLVNKIIRDTVYCPYPGEGAPPYPGAGEG